VLIAAARRVAFFAQLPSSLRGALFSFSTLAAQLAVPPVHGWRQRWQYRRLHSRRRHWLYGEAAQPKLRSRPTGR
jgi:hypothetical protein